MEKRYRYQLLFVRGWRYIHLFQPSSNHWINTPACSLLASTVLSSSSVALVWLLYVVDTFGRRPSLMVGSVGRCDCDRKSAKSSIRNPATLSSEGKGFSLYERCLTAIHGTVLREFSQAKYIHSCVYVEFIYVLTAEIFLPASMVASNWLYSFPIAYIYFFISSPTWAAAYALFPLFVFFFVPETK